MTGVGVCVSVGVDARSYVRGRFFARGLRWGTGGEGGESVDFAFSEDRREEGLLARGGGEEK